MQILYPKLRNADAIVIASPIYWFTMSAQTKLCIDRWYALEGPRGNALAGKQIGIVLTYGDSDQFTSGAINAMRAFEDMFRYVKADIVEMIHGSASNVGDVQKQPGLMEQGVHAGPKAGRVREHARQDYGVEAMFNPTWPRRIVAPSTQGPCPLFEEGQEFIVSIWGRGRDFWMGLERHSQV